MRTRAPLESPRPAAVLWTNDDDDTFTRKRDALSVALEELELPMDTPEDTVKILRLPDTF